MDKPKQDADFLIKEKNLQTGKNEIVGRGWKKTGQYGPFISLSLGKGDQRKSYIMVEAQARPLEGAPKKETPKPFPNDEIEDL